MNALKTASEKRRVVRGERIREIPAGTNIIEARGLELKKIIGCPYSGVDLDVKQGEVFAIRGRNGSGKTALLLTLAGRMLFTKGELSVLGHKMPRGMRKVQKRVGLSIFEGQNDLPKTQLARLSVGAEFELYGRKLDKDEIMSYLEEWNLAGIADKPVSQLNEDELTRLGIALAWAGHPDIIVVDDIEGQLTKDQSTEIMNDLLTLAHKRNVTILVGVIERDLAAMADDAYYL